MELKEWVKAARKHKDWTQTQLGDAMDRTKANIGHWESGQHKPSYGQIRAISEATGYPMPEANMEDMARLDTKAGRKSHANTEAVSAPQGEVPLISWIQAGDWNDANDPFSPGDAEDWIPCVRKHSPSSYALRVRGDSMTAAHGNSRTYPEGCIVFVDPEKRSPVNGERIIAKLSGPTADVTFKVFKQEDGRTWLQPINPTHLPIYDEFKVLGTVIGKWEDE